MILLCKIRHAKKPNWMQFYRSSRSHFLYSAEKSPIVFFSNIQIAFIDNCMIVVQYYSKGREFDLQNIKNQKSILPRCRSECCDPGLKYSHKEGEGILFYYHKIYQRKENASMDDQAHYHSHHVHPKLPCNHLQVSNGDYFSTDKAGDTNRRIPEKRYNVTLLSSFPSFQNECTKHNNRENLHSPHNCAHKLHNNFIQNVEKLQHQLGFLSHFPHYNSKSHKESNQPCMQNNSDVNFA